MKNNNNSKTGLGLVIGLSLGHGIKHFGQGALTVIGPMLKVSMGLSDVAYGAIFSALNVSNFTASAPHFFASSISLYASDSLLL